MFNYIFVEVWVYFIYVDILIFVIRNGLFYCGIFFVKMGFYWFDFERCVVVNIYLIIYDFYVWFFVDVMYIFIFELFFLNYFFCFRRIIGVRVISWVGWKFFWEWFWYGVLSLYGNYDVFNGWLYWGGVIMEGEMYY